MDKEQARFILRSFRPDGADATDHDFADALAFAMEHRELGEWLAKERAFDAAFAAALAGVAIPDHLRQSILDSLARTRADFPQADDQADAAMIGALATIQPPPALRAQILTAMERTAAANPGKRRFLPYQISIPLAAAAGVAMAFLFTRPAGHDFLTGNGPLPVDLVEASFIHDHQSPQLNLDVKREDHQELLANLKERQLPCPCCLPAGLSNVKGVGCSELMIHGKRGSLVCFEHPDHGIMHLVIFSRNDIEGDLPQCGRPSFSQDGYWSTARWSDASCAFLLIGRMDVHKLAALF